MQDQERRGRELTTEEEDSSSILNLFCSRERRGQPGYFCPWVKEKKVLIKVVGKLDRRKLGQGKGVRKGTPGEKTRAFSEGKPEAFRRDPEVFRKKIK